MEHWEQLYEFPDYEISDQGRIKNKYGRILTPSSNGKGVLKVALTRDAKVYHRSVAKLVAQTFLGEPPEGCTVIFVDHDHTNLEVSNLEWKPRWFAQERALQHKRTEPLRQGHILCEATGIIYANSLECANDRDAIEKYIISAAVDPRNRRYAGSSYRWVKD